MKPIQKSVSRSGAVIAAAGVALALTLSGCGSDQKDEKESDETAQSEDAGDAGGMQGEAAQTEEPTETAKSEPSKTTSEDPFKDSAKATSWASDDGIKVNKEGDGKIPAASLEADIDDLFKNKFKMKVKKVECRDDMKVMDWWGLTSCQVTDDETTYFGSVSLVDHKDNMVKYEVKFPGVDKSEVDF